MGVGRLFSLSGSLTASRSGGDLAGSSRGIAPAVEPGSFAGAT